MLNKGRKDGKREKSKVTQSLCFSNKKFSGPDMKVPVYERASTEKKIGTILLMDQSFVSLLPYLNGIKASPSKIAIRIEAINFSSFEGRLLSIWKQELKIGDIIGFRRISCFLVGFFFCLFPRVFFFSSSTRYESVNITMLFLTLL